MSAVKKGHFVTPKRQSWVSQFHLVIFAFLLMGNASSSVCVAAPITMWENDPQKLSELIESGAFSVASKPVEKKPTPLPQAVVFPQPQTVGLSGQSMTGSSVSTTVIVGASPAGLANAQ